MPTEHLRGDSLQEIKEQKENRKTFMKRVESFTNDEIDRIEMAYNLAKVAHALQIRNTGERYFEHCRAVTLVLLDESGVKDTDTIVASLLHDTLEDSHLIGCPDDINSVRREKEKRWYTKMFGVNAADIIISITKPYIDNSEIHNKKEKDQAYFNQLENAKEEAILIKMADRLHNLRTVENDQHRKEKIVTETKDKYIPLFERFLHRCETEEGLCRWEESVATLLNLIKKEVDNIEKTM